MMEADLWLEQELAELDEAEQFIKDTMSAFVPNASLPEHEIEPNFNSSNRTGIGGVEQQVTRATTLPKSNSEGEKLTSPVNDRFKTSKSKQVSTPSDLPPPPKFDDLLIGQQNKSPTTQDFHPPPSSPNSASQLGNGRPPAMSKSPPPPVLPKPSRSTPFQTKTGVGAITVQLNKPKSPTSPTSKMNSLPSPPPTNPASKMNSLPSPPPANPASKMNSLPSPPPTNPASKMNSLPSPPPTNLTSKMNSLPSPPPTNPASKMNSLHSPPPTNPASKFNSLPSPPPTNPGSKMNSLPSPLPTNPTSKMNSLPSPPPHPVYQPPSSGRYSNGPPVNGDVLPPPPSLPEAPLHSQHSPDSRGIPKDIPKNSMDELDFLTNNLLLNMENPKDEDFYGYCEKCGGVVEGENVGCNALDKIYHIRCFTCVTCGKQVHGDPFYVVEKKPFCEPCYIASLEKCSVCHQVITDRILRATGKAFHPTCFVCNVCGKVLDGVPFTVDESNKIYCVEDYQLRYAPRCFVCQRPILPEPGKEETLRIVAMDRDFHVNCYKCERCGVLFTTDEGCYPLDDHLYCLNCNTKTIQELSGSR